MMKVGDKRRYPIELEKFKQLIEPLILADKKKAEGLQSLVIIVFLWGYYTYLEQVSVGEIYLKSMVIGILFIPALRDGVNGVYFGIY